MSSKYLIVGNKGQLGREFERVLNSKGLPCSGFDYDTADIGDIDSLKRIFTAAKPDIVINCAAYNLVDNAEKDYETALRANATGVKNLALLCNEIGAFPVHYSTDYVFDGTKTDGLYTEKDIPNPLSNYAKSKYLGEQALNEVSNKFLLFRLSWVYGEGQQNFIRKLKEWAEKSDTLKIAFDEVSVPTSTKLITEVTLKALINGLTGLYHLTATGYASRYEWAKLALKLMGYNKVLYPVSKDIFNLPAPRPGFSAMSNKLISEKLNIEIPEWEQDLQAFIR